MMLFINRVPRTDNMLNSLIMPVSQGSPVIRFLFIGESRFARVLHPLKSCVAHIPPLQSRGVLARKA